MQYFKLPGWVKSFAIFQATRLSKKFCNISSYQVESKVLQYFKILGWVKSFAIFQNTRLSQNFFQIFSDDFQQLVSPYYFINLIQLVESLLNLLFFIFIYNAWKLFILYFTPLIMSDKKLQLEPFYTTSVKRTEFKGRGKRNEWYWRPKNCQEIFGTKLVQIFQRRWHKLRRQTNIRETFCWERWDLVWKS